jgi:tetratricopeptide (TPR) repeat protein
MRVASPGEGADLETFPEWHGIDLSRYNSFHQPSELFAQGVHRNFFGVYYSDPNYGVVHVADHHEVTGKKFWTWGVAGDGTIWTDLLTDADGPYNEIQAGRFETQFNRELMPAQGEESWTEYWYPVTQLEGGFLEATPQFAINVLFRPLHQANGEICVYLNPTERITNASLLVRLEGNVKKSFHDLTFEPGSTKTFVVPDADIQRARNTISVEVRSASGELLLHWNGADPVDGNAEQPAPGLGAESKVSKQPEVGAQELYLSGLREEKHGDRESAHRLFEEALNHDANYIPALRQLAVEEYLGADFEAAKRHIERALSHDDSDAETLYEAGIIRRASGGTAPARDTLWSSVRLGRSPAPALLQLGEIALSEREYANAQALLRRALRYQPDDVLAECDLSMALRLDGKIAEAVEVANRAVKTMPLFPMALAEQWRLATLNHEYAKADQARTGKRHNALEHRVQTYLEAGSRYWSLKDYESSELVFEAAAREFSAAELSPLVYYYLASCARHRGHAEEGANYAVSALRTRRF